LTPERWPTYFHGTRYRLLRRFPFIVVYRIRTNDLQIIASGAWTTEAGILAKKKVTSRLVLGFLTRKTHSE